MKRTFLFVILVGIFSFISIGKVSALNVENAPSSFGSNEIISIPLIALPENSENLVDIRLAANGLTIVNYTPPASNLWLGAIGQCDNERSYTTSEVCVTIIKSEPIVQGESLGSLTVEVKGGQYGAVNKSGTVYASPYDSRSDDGTLVEFNLLNKESSENGTLDPANSLSTLLPFVVAVIIILSVIVLGWLAAKSLRRRSSIQTVDSTTVSE